VSPPASERQCGVVLDCGAVGKSVEWRRVLGVLHHVGARAQILTCGLHLCVSVLQELRRTKAVLGGS
jgi:hypothetical protein